MIPEGRQPNSNRFLQNSIWVLMLLIFRCVYEYCKERVNKYYRSLLAGILFYWAQFNFTFSLFHCLFDVWYWDCIASHITRENHNYHFEQLHIFTIRHDKTRQEKKRQDKTRQDKTRLSSITRIRKSIFSFAFQSHVQTVFDSRYVGDIIL